MNELPFKIEEVMDYLQIDWRRYARGREVFNIPCPACDREGKRQRLNINTRKQVWRCPKCNNSGNAVNLANFYRTGISEINDKKLYAKELTALNQQISGEVNTRFSSKFQSKANAIAHKELHTSAILPDEELDRTYKTVLSILRLSDEHKEALIKRGLDEHAIEVNQYRSIPNIKDAKQYIGEKQMKFFADKKLGNLKVDMQPLKYMANTMILLGMVIAKKVEKKGYKTLGVPGFFKYGDYPCFYLPKSGIIIPTRNQKGQIVGMQVRADSGNIRYLTINNQNLDYAVVEKVSKPHWCLANDPLEEYDEAMRPEIILTEGPLKADVALHLMRKSGYTNPVAFVAIPGVLTTAEFLEKDCPYMKSLGYDSVTLAFDMDKLTNPNVMKGSKKLRGILKENGLKSKSLLWDMEYAEELLAKEQKLMEEFHLECPELTGNLAVDVATLSCILYDANVDRERFQWNPKTKGIDDFYLNKSKTE